MTEELTQKVDNLALEEEEKAPVILSKELTHYHPLNGKWTLWYTKPLVDKSESWSDLLKPIVTFSTVEEFWGIFNSIPLASELPLKSDYHLFREGIKPEWEDPQNASGGKWSYSFKEKKKYDINELWLRALLSAIGETLEEDEHELNGIVLNVRRVLYRVGLWSRTCNKERLEPIGAKFKRVLKLSDADQLEFAPHDAGDSKSARPLLVV